MTTEDVGENALEEKSLLIVEDDLPFLRRLARAMERDEAQRRAFWVGGSARIEQGGVA